MNTFVKKYGKLLLFAGLIVLMLVLNQMFGWSKQIGSEGQVEALKELVETHLLQAILIYVLLTVVGCVALALPGVTFAIIAGLLFGPVLGTICCTAAATIGAMLAFLMGRFFLKDSIKPLAMKNKYLKRWLFDENGQNTLFVLMITRLVPLFPFNLQNFAYGVTDIPFLTYSVGSFVFMLPGTAMYTIGTAGLADPVNRVRYLIIAAVIAVAVMVLGAVLKKKYVQPEEK